jgi:hypothetical protein
VHCAPVPSNISITCCTLQPKPFVCLFVSVCLLFVCLCCLFVCLLACLLACSFGLLGPWTAEIPDNVIQLTTTFRCVPDIPSLIKIRGAVSEMRERERFVALYVIRYSYVYLYLVKKKTSCLIFSQRPCRSVTVPTCNLPQETALKPCYGSLIYCLLFRLIFF